VEEGTGESDEEEEEEEEWESDSEAGGGGESSEDASDEDDSDDAPLRRRPPAAPARAEIVGNPLRRPVHPRANPRIPTPPLEEESDDEEEMPALENIDSDLESEEEEGSESEGMPALEEMSGSSEDESEEDEDEDEESDDVATGMPPLIDISSSGETGSEDESSDDDDEMPALEDDPSSHELGPGDSDEESMTMEYIDAMIEHAEEFEAAVARGELNPDGTPVLLPPPPPPVEVPRERSEARERAAMAAERRVVEQRWEDID
ncbi:hypothetical protein P7C70_g7200, partial [Phenoliferia sp. Uapishka_3]